MEEIFDETVVIPVLTIDNPEDAVPLAAALVRGGLTRLEVAFRTEAAPAAIAAIHRAVPSAIVGAGTLLRPADVTRAVEAGARFLVSPGFTPSLVAAGLATGLLYIPGVATPSEMMAARDLGCSLLKFFPASSMGGPATLAALAPIFRGVAFCPTGGVTQETASQYLKLPNVPMVAGTWMATAVDMRDRNWGRVEDLARAAAKLKRG
jgi:2-dehydro-3-deoxyphosphogluconate aldolase / (4S)-4-hydroxy-2-oxoglutarate aldolase